VYSQFFPRIWGFKVGARQKASQAVLGIFWGCLLGILVVYLLVQTKGKDGGYDAESWAWVDVVRTPKPSEMLMARAD
jgi:cystinosin